MNKKILLIMAIGIISLVPILLMIGCPQPNELLYGARVAGDSNGGAFVVYEATKGGNIYIQKISAEGNVLWQRDFSYFNQLVSDGNGGAIIYYDNPLSTNSDNKDLVIVKIDSNGDYPRGLQGVIAPVKDISLTLCKSLPMIPAAPLSSGKAWSLKPPQLPAIPWSLIVYLSKE